MNRPVGKVNKRVIDLLGKKWEKRSIEYIKKYKINKEDYVLVAIRVSNNEQLFARTMYVMADEKVEKYFKHNYFYNINFKKNNVCYY